MKAYKEVIEELAEKVDSVTIHPVNAQDEYSLSPMYNIINDSMA